MKLGHRRLEVLNLLRVRGQDAGARITALRDGAEVSLEECMSKIEQRLKIVRGLEIEGLDFRRDARIHPDRGDLCDEARQVRGRLG